MSNRITTTILGKTNTGKTCYLMALYNMMKAGVTIGDCQLSLMMPTEKGADDNYFKLQYRKLKEKSSWPLANPANEVNEYELFLVKDLADRLPFSWIDYSGELLEEQGHIEEKAYTTVVNRLKQESTSVLFPLKGELFATPIPTNEWELAEFKGDHGYDKFNSLMSEYISSRNNFGRPPIVTLLITMYDLCSQRDFSDIVTEIQTLFPPLFKGKCITGIIPVSLGSGSKGKFVVRPRQVHLPLIFILLQELEITLKAIEGIELKFKGILDRWGNTWYGPLIEKLFGNSTIAEIRDSLKEFKAFRDFFLPFQKVFKRTLEQGTLVYYDEFPHEIGMDKQPCK